jgi:hypothetical protein
VNNSPMSEPELIKSVTYHMDKLLKMQHKANLQLGISFDKVKPGILPVDLMPSATNVINGICNLTDTAVLWRQAFASLCAFAYSGSASHLELDNAQLAACSTDYVKSGLQIVHAADVALKLLSRVGAKAAATDLNREVLLVKRHLSYVPMPMQLLKLRSLVKALAIEPHDDTVTWQGGEYELLIAEHADTGGTAKFYSEPVGGTDANDAFEQSTQKDLDDSTDFMPKLPDIALKEDINLSILESMLQAVAQSDGRVSKRKGSGSTAAMFTTAATKVVSLGDVRLNLHDVLVSMLTVYPYKS